MRVFYFMMNQRITSLIQYPMSLFKAHPVLNNSHIQTLLPYYFRPTHPVMVERTRITLPDSDFIDLDICNTSADENAPIIILFHGLEGSSKSKYINSMLYQTVKLNWRGIAVNFRGCSGVPNNLPKTYHSGETMTPQSVIEYAHNKWPQALIFTIGYSLGGSVLLNTLSKCNQANLICASCVISVPFDLARGADRMNRGLSKFYRNHFIKNLKSKIRIKKNIIDKSGIHIDYERMECCTDFWEYDDCITAPLNGFKNVHDYYQTCSTLPQLKNITKPTLIIHAEDDPFMMPESTPTADNISSAIKLCTSSQGGHVGFTRKNSGVGLNFNWVDETILNFLKQHLSEGCKELNKL